MIILRRPPRFDPANVDPLQLKPQLSSLGNAFLFDLWCSSKFKSKIFLGDHQLPHLVDDSHHLVYGHPGHGQNDGLHMYGPEGRKTFQASVLNILRNAKLLKRSSYPEKRKYIPGGGKVPSSNQKGYNPMKILKERHTFFTEQSRSSTDDVPFPPAGATVFPSSISTSSSRKPSRPSVIQSNCRQESYSVPISNHLDILGN